MIFLPLSISDLLSMNFPQLDLPVASCMTFCMTLISQCFPGSLNVLLLKENTLFFQGCNTAPAVSAVISLTQAKLSSPSCILCLLRSSLIFPCFVVLPLTLQAGPCLSSVVAVNTVTRSDLGEQMVYFILKVTVHHRGKSGKEVKAGRGWR